MDVEEKEEEEEEEERETESVKGGRRATGTDR